MKRYKIVLDAEVDIKKFLKFLASGEAVDTVYNYEHEIVKEEAPNDQTR
jgi:hypothetical protein